MSDKIVELLKEQGFETTEAAIEHLKTLAAVKTAKEEESESLKAVIDAAVDQRLQSLAPKPKMKTPASDAPDAEVNMIKDDVWLLGHVLQKHPKNMDAATVTRGFVNNGIDVSEAAIRKAMDTADLSEIVPMDMARTLMSDIEKLAVVASNFRVMTMPTNPWESPYQSSSMTLYGVDENTADAGDVVGASDADVAKITFTAKKMGARTLWSRELDEDSAIAMLPFIREDFMRIMRDGWERTFITGDETTANTNINQVGTAPTTTAGAKSYWLQADGMVHHCIITHTHQAHDIGAAVTAKDIFATRLLLGKYGDALGDVVMLSNRELVYDLLVLDEVLTVDKYGAGATILTGELGRIAGIPILLTDGLPLNDDDGKWNDTPADNDNKAFLLVNKQYGAVIGRRGELRMAVGEINKTDQYEGVIYSRYDIQFLRDTALAYGYNIT